ncbi:MAG: polyphenol oxidase family protein [Planctomycetota bacterium]
MFRQVQLGSGQRVWRSSLLDDLGVPHLFTTCAWDVKSSDDIAEVVGAARWFTGHPPRIVMAKQVHGNAVSTPAARIGEADAHLTQNPHEVVAVRTADCVPVLISSADGGLVAVVHAGWRGLDPAMNVIGQTVAALIKAARGSLEVAGCVAAIGPCISLERYEVGEEVASRFRGAVPEAVRDDLGDKPHLDTRAVAAAQLRDAGLLPDRIDVFPGCTFNDPELFSYRQQGKGVGHLAAMISPGQSA